MRNFKVSPYISLKNAMTGILMGFVLTPVGLHASAVLAEQAADPIRSQIEDIVHMVDQFVSSGQFGYMDTLLTPDCVGKSSLTPRMNCKDMYIIEISDLFAACGSECAGSFTLRHEVEEVASMSNGDVWAWTTATATTPAGACLTKYEANNRFTRSKGTWQMERILLMRVPCDE